ncbi:hypothetical protein [Nonomuraea sp. B19D2]|uniref:hypothetical protein n=1 Tax=Nonomuraea sp. B19D2 TaxID=3159561 RepID=UPI0032DA015C
MVADFLSEFGKKLAERWFSLLVLPGALFLAVAVAARTLGHAHATDLPRLAGQVTAWAAGPAAGGWRQVVLLAAILAAAAMAGLAAQGLGALVERLTLAAGWHNWPAPLRLCAARLVARRLRRWNAAATRWHRLREEAARARARGRRADPAARRAARRAMTRVALEPPDRPTWCGDRLNAVAVRLERDLHVDASVCWPHLWLILPDATRAEITTARQALTRATTLTAWAALYLTLTWWWWPAAAIGGVLALAGWRRARAAADAYAVLLEAAARLHIRDLANQLGLDAAASPADAGEALTRFLESPPPAAGKP